MPINKTESENELISASAYDRDPAKNPLKRADAVQEIISRKPRFMERWSVMIFLLLLIMMIFGAWLIRYPEYVEVDATLTAASRSNNVYLAQATISQNEFSKIESGQLVQLSFDPYPFGEFGLVEGYVTHISTTLTGGGFLIDIVLPKALVTSRGKTIPFIIGLRAHGVILLPSSRLLQRWYGYMVHTTHHDK